MDTVAYGPRRIAAKNQISIPDELLQAVGMHVGDSVWIAINPERPGTLVVLPRSQAIEVFQAGWQRTRPELHEGT